MTSTKIAQVGAASVLLSGCTEKSADKASVQDSSASKSVCIGDKEYISRCDSLDVEVCATCDSLDVDCGKEACKVVQVPDGMKCGKSENWQTCNDYAPDCFEGISPLKTYDKCICNGNICNRPDTGDENLGVYCNDDHADCAAVVEDNARRLASEDPQSSTVLV